MASDNSLTTVVVGMSGGVDSSVAAYLLKQDGYKVIGLFMKNWDEEDDECPAAKDYQDVIAVCSMLDIPYYTINFVDEYYDHVFADFLEGLKMGITPNPDIFCNKEIKFKVFLDKAKEIGADYLATGHWAKTGEGLLEKCSDDNKDQTYFLYTLKSKQLKQVMFPLANLNKSRVREIAKELNLITHDKKDSTGICFIGKRKFKDFIAKFIQKEKGNFVDENGKILGMHDGIAFYTIGQRKGLQVGGPGEAWYVAAKETSKNEILLVQGENHPMLLHDDLIASSITWVSEPPVFPLDCTAKIRYRQDEQACTVTQLDDKLHVKFASAQRAVTPGQSIVFYKENLCLGGAIIN
ncbi:MAG: tRNA 2-thiouridine(34) synthase MnmA [Rhabdochlamydiaceae bacterium]|nr:tRNA 2-thiouridine(34) synthase MnmA [Candidatus Amphrikana amoebophyrae]